jgi:hypothetical protein
MPKAYKLKTTCGVKTLVLDAEVGRVERPEKGLLEWRSTAQKRRREGCTSGYKWDIAGSARGDSIPQAFSTKVRRQEKAVVEGKNETPIRLRGNSAQLVGGFVLSVLALIAVAGCDRIGGRTVMVEFRSAEGLDSGRPVYFAGVKVGETGSPTIVKGQARVPVYLSRRHRDALPSGAVFAVGDDPNNPSKRCLLGYAVSTVPHRAEDDTEVYQGVSSEVELALLIGAEQAREFMEKLKRLYPQ